MRVSAGILAALALATCGTPQPSAARAAATPARLFAAWADEVTRDQAALETATNAYDRSIRQAIRSNSYDQALQAFEAYDDAVGAVYRRLGPIPAIDVCPGAWMGPAGKVARAESEELEAHERIIARLRRVAEDGAGRNVAVFAISGDQPGLDRARATIASLLRKARSGFYAAEQKDNACAP